MTDRRQMYAETVHYALLSPGELDRLREQVSTADAVAKAATDWTEKTRAESDAKSLRHQLNSAELARREEDRASQARFDARYMSVNESKGLPEFAEPVHYDEPPPKPRLTRTVNVRNRAVAWPQKMSERQVLLEAAVAEVKRVGLVS